MRASYGTATGALLPFVTQRVTKDRSGRRRGPASLASMPSRPDDADAQVATELAELEALAAALPEDEIEGVPPVAGPQDWE
jgi:hypothetical protein